MPWRLESKVVREVVFKVGLGRRVVDSGSRWAKGQDAGGGTFTSSNSGKCGGDWRIFAEVRSALKLHVRWSEGG
jgi:hypothetical protein